jgi:hypothetical protein
VTLADSVRFQFTPDLTICRLLNGMWQVSGAHGYIEPARAIAEMFAYHDAGLTTWDLADTSMRPWRRSGSSRQTAVSVRRSRETYRVATTSLP